MNWLKELSFVLIVGCLAVLTAASEKTSSDTPRIIDHDDHDLRLLINPFAFLQTKPTAKPERPPTIVVRPPYHYPYYPYYPNDDDHHHHPHPTHPTYPPTHPTFHPTKPTGKPIYPQIPPYPPTYPNYPPNYPQYPFYPPFGSYPPWINQQQPAGQVPFYVFIQPTPNVPVVPPKTPRSFGYPNIQSVKGNEDFQDPEEVAEEQQAQNDNEDELVARNIKLDGVSIAADSDEDADTISIDTKDVKLPFGLHLASYPVLGRKIKDQEALIYLKNFKKGRQLTEGKTA